MRWWPRYRIPPYFHPTLTQPVDAPVTMRWLGTAGFVIKTKTTTVLIDPFLSRPSVRQTVLFPLEPKPELWWDWLPFRADAVITGHSHYDHLMDAPLISKEMGAKLIGSWSSQMFAKAHGLPEDQTLTIDGGGGSVTVGDVVVTMVPSLHGRVVAGRVPFPGIVDQTPRLPARLHQYRMGGAFGIHLQTPWLSIYHNGSADLIDAHLAGLQADVLVVGLAGRRATRDYLKRLVTLLEPKVIIPTHHDLFFSPLEEGLRLLPGIDMEGFLASCREVAPNARVFLPSYEHTLALPEHELRDAAFVQMDISA